MIFIFGIASVQNPCYTLVHNESLSPKTKIKICLRFKTTNRFVVANTYKSICCHRHISNQFFICTNRFIGAMFCFPRRVIYIDKKVTKQNTLRSDEMHSAQQIHLIKSCIDDMITAAGNHQNETFCSPHVCGQFIDKLRQSGYKVTFVKQLPAYHVQWDHVKAQSA